MVGVDADTGKGEFHHLRAPNHGAACRAQTLHGQLHHKPQAAPRPVPGSLPG
jgi:hypothetical protein